MRRFRAALVLAVALAGCAHAGRTVAPATPPAGSTVAVDLGEHGQVVYRLPDGWRATSGETEPPLPASIRFEPPAGHLVLLITPFWRPGDPAEPLGPEVALGLVEAARDRTLGGALEESLPIRPLESPGLRGWYFAATDRALAGQARPALPDEYRCLVQGAAVAGPLLLAFSLLDDGDGPQRVVALALVRGATHRPTPVADPGERPSEPPGLRRPDPSRWAVRGAEPLELGLRGAAWSLLLDLPGWRVAEPLRRLDGSGVTVVGQRQEDGLVLSASVVASASASGADDCRDLDWPRMARLEGVGEARLESSPGIARAWYTVRDGGTPTRHLSAWRHRPGACIHLHLSLPGSAPAVEATLERALGAARFAESL